MIQQSILKDLYGLVKSQSIKIRFVADESTCGFCVINNKETLIVNRNLPEQIKIREIAKIIKQNNLDYVYIKPYLREIIENLNENEKRL